MGKKLDNKNDNNEKGVDIRIFTQIAEELKKETENIGKPAKLSDSSSKPSLINIKEQKKPIVEEKLTQQQVKPLPNVPVFHNVHKHIKKKEGKYHLDLKNIFAGFHQQSVNSNGSNKTTQKQPTEKNEFKLIKAYSDSEIKEKPEISVELDIIKSIGDEDQEKIQPRAETKKKDSYIQDIIEEVKKTESTLVKPQELDRFKEIEEPIVTPEKTKIKKELQELNEKKDERYEVINLPEVITYAPIPKKLKKPIKNIFDNIESERLNKEIEEVRKQKHKNIKQVEKNKEVVEIVQNSFVNKPSKEYKLPDLFSKELSFKVDISRSHGFEQEDNTNNNKNPDNNKPIEPPPIKKIDKTKAIKKLEIVENSYENSEPIKFEEPNNFIVKTTKITLAKEKIPREAYLKKPDVEQISESISDLTRILANRNQNLSWSFKESKNSYEEDQEKLNILGEKIKNNIIIMNKDFSWPKEI